MFRLLKASEIDCRINQIYENTGLSLLLYKDARVDMTILDETVGPMNWQRRHTRDNANCEILIWDVEKKMWVGKEDTGTESYTEKEKGLASDSFKRAGVNWGIGRELYTSPYIYIPASACTIKTNPKTGKPVCYDRFRVVSIDYDEERNISGLEIANDKTGAVVFSWPSKCAESKVGEDTRLTALKTLLKQHGIMHKTICDLYKVAKLSELTENQHANIANNLDKIKEAQDGKQSATA